MVDFKSLRAIPIADVCRFLGVELKPKWKQLRGICPLCKHQRTFAVTPAKQLFYCFKCKQYGDGLELVVLVKNLSHVEAAKLLTDHFRPP